MLQLPDSGLKCFRLLFLVIEPPVQVLRLSLFSFLDQFDLFIGCVKLPLQVVDFVLDGLVPHLELLEFVFKVVHMNLHLVLKLDMATDIRFQFLHHFFVRICALLFVSLVLFVQRVHCLLHTLHDQVLGAD